MKHIIKRLICFGYFSPIIFNNKFISKNIFKKIYSSNQQIQNSTEKTIFYVVLPQTTFSGGLSDRFRGIISVYNECKKLNLPFKIYFKTPTLTDYLIPNKYNWEIEENSISFNLSDSYPCTVLTYHNFKSTLSAFSQRVMLNYFIKRKKSQIHIFTNAATAEKNFSYLFNELFKPSPILQEQIDFHLNKLNGKGNYDAIIFRFRQLLGDFKEGGEILLPDEREAYIKRCLDSVKKYHKLHPRKKILVTSDSLTFLKRVNQLDYVYIIPGNIVHIGFTHDADKKTYLKSFVDYFVISYAKNVILMRDSKMYHSGFAYRAALLNDAQYNEYFI